MEHLCKVTLYEGQKTSNSQSLIIKGEKKNNFQIEGILKVTGLMITLLSLIFSISLGYMENRRVLKITEYQLDGISEVMMLEQEYSENPYTESFLHGFSDAYVIFNLENHSKIDIEIYGFYLEIQVENLKEKIMVPLEAEIKGEEGILNVFLSDWKVAEEIDKYIVKSNATIESFAALKLTCANLDHIWFLDSGLCEETHPISAKIEKAYVKQKSIKCKCRIACRDTFGEYYYSPSKTVIFNP